jgi:hypothetical protein
MARIRQENTTRNAIKGMEEARVGRQEQGGGGRGGGGGVSRGGGVDDAGALHEGQAPRWCAVPCVCVCVCACSHCKAKSGETAAPQTAAPALRFRQGPIVPNVVPVDGF